MKIATERNYQKWSSWDVVYEWEDIISRINNWDLFNLYGTRFSKQKYVIRKILRKLNLAPKKFRLKDKNELTLCFIMDARYYQLYTKRNIIPCFLDFSIDMLNEIVNATRELPVFFVTSYDIYLELCKCGVKNVSYIPLSISDKHLGCSNKKTIDVIQFGRKNKKLHNYMIRYTKEFPSVEYVYQSEDGSREYISTIKGNIGKLVSREAYLDLLSRCKISLVSTPGIDFARDFGGIDFVTPRFYESAIFKCVMIGRYTKNKESELLGLAKVVTFVETYEEFKYNLDRILSKNFVQADENVDKFIFENLTSKRAEKYLEEIINALD